MLLNFTKKKWTKDFLPGKLRHELLFDPFCRTVSRLKFSPDLFNYELKAEYLPDFFRKQVKSVSWQECCYERAKALLALDRERYWISWSGGIDSTVMMISILQVWPKEALDRITVFLSHSSVYENPEFFDKYITHFPLRSSLNDISSELLKTDALLLTGELGDQLFGSDILAPSVQSLGDGVLHRKYQDAVPQVIDLWNRKANTGQAIFEHFHPMIEESPVPIRSVFDFFWWMNFSQKWQHVKYRFVELTSWNLEAKYGSHLLHFFDTPEFQRWSIDNHDLKIGKNWDHYKLAAKEFIVKFTKNQADMLQPKRPSLALRHFLVEKRLAVTADLKPVQTIPELETYVRPNA